MKKLYYLVFLFIFLYCFLFNTVIFSEEIPPELLEIYKISPGIAKLYSHEKIFAKISGKNKISEKQCLTMEFKNLLLNFNKLSPKAQAYAKRYLFKRPTEYQEDPSPEFADKEPVLSYEATNGHFKFYYSITHTSRANEVSNVVTNSYGIPDYVLKCSQLFESAWVKEVDEMGYIQPESDKGWKDIHGNEYFGGDGRLDIYILHLSGTEWGYTIAEIDPNNKSKKTCPSYIVINNAYPESIFGFHDPYDNLRFTSAHEFFHAIQYSYNYLTTNDSWWQEACAVWMEDQVYNNINGYYIFLPEFFKKPWISLSSLASSHEYASGIFPIFLTSHFKDTGIIKSIWEKSSTNDFKNTSPINVIDYILQDYNSNMENAFTDFTVYNYFTGDNYNPYVQGDKYYPEAAYYTTEIAYSYIHNTYPVFNDTRPVSKQLDTTQNPNIWASNYILFNSEKVDSNLKIHFQGGGSYATWRLNLILITPNNFDSTVKIPLDSADKGDYIIRNFGSIYQKAILVPMLVKADTTIQKKYEYQYSAQYVDDTTAPEKVRNLKAVSDGDSDVTLTWDTSYINNLYKIIVYRKILNEPLFGSTEIFNGLNSTCTDFLSNNDNALYSVFTFNEMNKHLGPETTSIIMIDTTSPKVITGLIAKDHNSSGKVDLDWSGYKNDNMPKDVVSYKLYQSLSPFQDVSNLSPFDSINNKDQFKATAANLENGTRYYFAVTAVDEAGNENKNVINATAIPTLDTTAPSPVHFEVSSEGGSGIANLEWATYNEDKEKDVCFYRIYKSNSIFSSPSANKLYDSVKVGTKTYTLKDLTEGVVYYFAVTAIDEMKNENPDISVKPWGFNKITFTSPVSDEIKIYKNGNYAYKGELVGSVQNNGEISFSLFPKNNFLLFSAQTYSAYYTIADVVNGNKTISVTFRQAVSPDDTVFDESSVILNTQLSHVAPFVVDWNNDGKKDLLIGDSEGYVYLYKNIGTDTSVSFAEPEKIKADNEPLKVTGNAVPFVVDWDNDGRKDLLVGSSDGMVYIFMNNGTDDEPTFLKAETLKDTNGVELNVGGNASPFVVDWNFDNKKDVLIGSYNGIIYPYINGRTGTDYDPLFEENNNSFSIYINEVERLITSRIFIAPTQWNTVEKNNILIGDISGNIYWSKNNGSNVFTTESLKTSSGENLNVGNYASPFLVDWNNDNVMDIVTGNAKGQVLVFYGKEAAAPRVHHSSKLLGPCFITNIFHKSDNLLKQFLNLRDKFLLNNKSGKYFVEKYYKLLTSH